MPPFSKSLLYPVSSPRQSRIQPPPLITRVNSAISFSYGEMAVHDCKVIQSGEKIFVAMPCQSTGDGTYRDIIHPLNAAFRKVLEKQILYEYGKYISSHTTAKKE